MAVLVPRLADDTGIVAAGGQNECEFAVVQRVQLKHRTPSRDLIAFDPHDEHRQIQIAE